MRHLPGRFAGPILGLFLVLGVVISLNTTAAGQRRPYRMTDRQVGELIRALEGNADRFRNSLDASLDRSRTDGTRTEDDINAFVRDFDDSVEHLRSRFESRQSVVGDLESVLQRASVIDNFIVRTPGAGRSRRDWNQVRNNLNALANAYGIGWNWDRSPNVPYGTAVGQRDRNWDRYGNYGGSFDLRQTALNAGYNEGMKVGQRDRGRSNPSDYRNSTNYERATTDYSSRLGDRELYRRYYREGFENGYNDGFGVQTGVYPGVYPENRNRDWNSDDRHNRRGRNWDRYGTYGGSFELRQTALNAGYNEGIKVGRQDRNRNGGSDFRNSNAYQSATKDYSSKLGDRELYRRYYREGFENGYNDGYNGH